MNFSNNLNQTLPLGLDLKLPIHTIETVDLYNILQDISASKLIIDLRKKSDFDKLQIKTAVNIPPPVERLPTDGSDEFKRFSIHKYISDNVTAKYWNLVFQRVIIYADKAFQYDVDALSKLDYDSLGAERNIKLTEWNQAMIEHFVSKRKTTLVYVYQGGFESFYKRYPFMCSQSGDKLIDLYATEVIEGFLFLGSKENAHSRKQLQDLKITYIVNMAKELNDIYAHIYKYYRADLDDHPKADIVSHFDPIFKFLDEAKKSNARVLVHCAMGISRSATIVIAYLMKEYNFDYPTAFKYVKSKRSIISPNFGFTKVLKDYDKFLENERQKRALRTSNNGNLTAIPTTTPSTTPSSSVQSSL